MKHFIKAAIILSLLFFLIPSRSSALAITPVDGEIQSDQPDAVCPGVQNTPFFTIVYGTITLNGSAAPVGSLVKAYSPRNDLVGCFSITSAGNYGAMYIYGEDTTVSPAIPGMRANEAVSFTIDDIPATSTPTLQWINDKDLHSVNLASVGISANFTAIPANGVAPLIVQFSDSSSGPIDTWQWNFGDGQSSPDRNPQHTYTSPGSYTVSLTVSGSSGSDTESRTNYITVFTPVNANFDADPISGIAPLMVTFTNQSSGDFTSSSWIFGDGGTSLASNPTHTYATGGIYTVYLTASGPGGTNVEIKTGYITVFTPATADFTATPTAGDAPLSVTFTNTSGGDFSSMLWNFGDGFTSTDPNPTHIYQNSGIYTVALTITGNGGSDTETKTDFIIVGSQSFVYLPLIIR